jgi:FixJ family two-component response regulator
VAPTLFVVDDDPATRDSLHFLAESVHLPIVSPASARSSSPATIGRTRVAAARHPHAGMSGLELQGSSRRTASSCR